MTGLAFLALAVLCGVVAMCEAWLLTRPMYSERDETMSRYRILRELNDIELHRPDHILNHHQQEKS